MDNSWDGTFRNLTAGDVGIENRSDTVMENHSDVLANKCEEWKTPRGDDEESATVATDLAEIVSDTELIGIRSSSFGKQEASRDKKVFVDSFFDSSFRENMSTKQGDFCALADFCDNEG